MPSNRGCAPPLDFITLHCAKAARDAHSPRWDRYNRSWHKRIIRVCVCVCKCIGFGDIFSFLRNGIAWRAARVNIVIVSSWKFHLSTFMRRICEIYLYHIYISILGFLVICATLATRRHRSQQFAFSMCLCVCAWWTRINSWIFDGAIL